jgi:cellobiose epimerase
MSSPASLDYLGRIETDLRRNILPFWIEKAVNPADGAFFGSLTNDLIPDLTAERGALLTTRILWTYSAAFRQYRDPVHLAMADRAYRDLFAHFHDSEHGGFYWSIAADGAVKRDRKQIYGQAFAIYALSEYHAANGRREPLDKAIALFHLIENNGHEFNHGGYLEAFDRQWKPIEDMRLSAVDQNDPKSQNTHLHVLEAYTNLLRVWPDARLQQALSDLLNIMLTHIVDARTGHLGLFFSEDWKPRSNKISYGHDIEAAWLFTEAATALRDPTFIERTHALAVKIAAVTLAEGIDIDGGVYNEGSPTGLTNTNKEWWPQAEAVVGFLNAYQISGEERFLRAALHTWDFIEKRLIDSEHGEWLRGVTRDGQVLSHELKVGFWKCPYHNGRTGLESVRRLRAITNHV